MKRLIYIFYLLSMNYALHSQCDANFIVLESSGDFQFTNVSTIADDDNITSRLWRFGDGNTTTNENPSHTYNALGIYDVILQIATESGCNSNDTMSIEVCNINLDFNLSSVCDSDGEIALILEIDDESNVLDSVYIYLDDILVIDTAVIIPNGILNYNIKVPGDGNQHFVRVESLPNGFCSESISFFVQDCNASCFLSDLVIDDGYQETHNIVLLESGFAPSNREINLGDRVRFIWLDGNHSSTSVDTISSDQWDTGVQDSSYIFEMTPKNPGIKPFYSTPDGESTGPYSGNLIANCPENRGSLINISFLNAAVPNAGFYLGIDGVILKDTIYEYNQIGLTNVEFFLPGDDKTHQISVIDIEDKTCTIKETVKAINCNGFFECSLNVNAEILERCNEDSLVLVGINVSSLSPTDLGVEIKLDDTIVVDTIYYTGSQASVSLPIFGDGLVHTIMAMDLSDSFCVDEVAVLVNDCSAPCGINQLEIGTGSNNTIVLAVTDFTISLKDLTMSSGDDILWQWIQDSLVGVRSVDESGTNSWDSGLKTDGAIFISPILTAGLHPYYLYNAAGDTLYNATVEVIASCDENKIPVFYNFLDVNGSVPGFDIYIDSIRLETGPFQYALDGHNRGVFQLEGDDQEHLIEIRDLSKMECFAGASFVAPTCEVTPCGGMIELLLQDSCYNDNTINYLATVNHPNPSEQGFIFRLNGELFDGFPFLYGTNGETQFTGSLKADSTVYIFTYVDLADPECQDVLIYQSPVCVTDCNIQLVSAQLVDSFFLMNNPNTPDSLAGCQDSFINVAVLFNEEYSDSDSFRIVVDSVLDETIYGYKLGDGLNTIFVSVKGDDAFHTIQIIDHIDTTCTFSTEIYTPMCFSACNIEIENIVLDSCVNEIGYYTLNLDTTTNKYNYQVFYDGDSIEVVGDSLLGNFIGIADGLEHYILVSDNEEPLCKDSVFFIGSYCLDCPLDIQIVQIDSCEIGDSIGYSIIFSAEIDSLDVTVEVGDTSFIINPKLLDFNYDIRLRGDSSFYQYIFTSNEDQFCKDTINIQTIDCTPIICDPNFSFTIEGLTITFLDSSTTSEPIIDQSWSINQIVSIGNVSTFNFTVDSIGLYDICHTITTDSCSSDICVEVLVGDPCTEIIPFFTFEKIAAGYQFTNMSTGNIDEYLYRFDDGIVSNNADPFHVFPDTGVYEVCLIVRQDEFSCEEKYCEFLDVTLNSSSDVDLDKNLVVYPNPISHDKKGINFIYETNLALSKKNISIIDIQGRKINDFSLMNKSQNRFELSFGKYMNSGIYYLIVRDEDGSMDSVKFVVY
jgi:PKD repeat protein